MPTKKHCHKYFRVSDILYSRWNSLDIFWDNVYRYDTKVGSCCIQTVSGEYYLTLSIVAIYDRGQLKYRRQRWLRGGDWNGGESGDWEVVTKSDTQIYRGIFGVILYSSDGIYLNISTVTIMWKNNLCYEKYV